MTQCTRAATCKWTDCEVILTATARGRMPTLCPEHRLASKRQHARDREKLSTTPCAAQDCARMATCKGLCGKHYKQTRPRTVDKVETVVCDCCATTYQRMKRATDRWAGSFCSYLCRDYEQYGPRSMPLPRDHISRHLNATCKWTPPFIAHETECAWCGGTMTANRPTQRFCGLVCKKRQQKATRRGREHNAIGTYSWAEIVRLWVAFNKTCAYCSKPTPLEEIQAEHVVPLSRGGANNLTNLLPSCLHCNGDKRDLLLSEWNPDRVRRGLTKVNTTWHTADPRYRHLVTAGNLAA